MRGLARLKRDPGAWAGGLIVLALVLTALLAPWLAPHDPMHQDLVNRLKPPGGPWLLGTDQFGRDVLSRLIWGARISLQVGLISVSIGAVTGTVVGLVAGVAGRWLDTLVMRVVDIMLAFPTVLLALFIAGALGSSLTNMMIAIGVTTVPHFIRIVRAETLVIRELEYVTASRAAGASPLRVVVRHVLPGVISPIIVYASLQTANAIIVEASLTYLGLGIDPSVPTWGGLISQGRNLLDLAPWISLSGGFAVFITVLGLNLFGDALRDALDPKLLT
ncbi:MAG TPA: ABC transporter permease [Limnochordales bacterium]